MSGRQAGFRSTFIGGAIATASSPLRNGFIDASCCSPVTARRPSRPEEGRSSLRGHHDDGAARPTRYSDSRHLSLPITSPVTSEKASSSRATSPTNSVHGHDNGYKSASASSPAWRRAYALQTPLTPQLLCPQDVASSTDFDEGKLGTFSAINIIIGKTVGVGIYSVPSSIFVGVGSVGMSILMWVLGAVISFCGLAVYLDLGTAIPRSGGERVYLERIFRRPHMLATCMFMAYVVLLGFSTPNCIVLGEYAMYALGVAPDRWNVRGLAVAVITILCLVHARHPRAGLRIINVLGVGKMLIVAVVVLAGVAAMALGVGGADSQLYARRLLEPTELGPAPPPAVLTSSSGSSSSSTAARNFRDVWAGSSTQPYDYATALLRVLYCFRGYSTANQVMSSMRRPAATLRAAAPAALALVSAGYVLANIAYFLAVEKDDFRRSGVVVAGHFFRNVFGRVVGERVLPCFVVVSAFGNIAATSYAQARVNQELGRDGLLPFAGFFARENRCCRSPTSGLFLHWLVSVIVIVVPPPGEIYDFLVAIGGYPVSVISVAISLGLLYLQSERSGQKWVSPCRASKLYTGVFAASNMFLLVFPWVKPTGERSGKEGGFPYYAYPATAMGVLAIGVVYWVWWSWRKGMWVSWQEKEAGRPDWTISSEQYEKSKQEEVAMRRFKKKDIIASKFEGSLLLGSHDKEEEIDENRRRDREDHVIPKSSKEIQDQTWPRRRAPCGCMANHGKATMKAREAPEA